MKKIMCLMAIVLTLTGCSSSKLNKAIENSKLENQKSMSEQVKLIGRYEDNFYSIVYLVTDIENKKLKYELNNETYIQIDNNKYKCSISDDKNICNITDEEKPFDPTIFLDLIKNTKNVKRVDTNDELRYTYNINKDEFIKNTKFLNINFDIKEDVNVSVLIEDKKVAEIVFYLYDKNNNSINLTINYYKYNKSDDITLDGYEVSEG